ncbi:M48 family metallopeptidase [Pseudomonas sp. R2.Fl]|nr:M48 family metallopeptidase [Pseudomonas sp. R2.Fl]
MIFSLQKKKPLRQPPADRVLNIDGRSMPLVIRQNERSTRITLRIEPGGRSLKMTVPPGLSEYEVSDFLERYRGWLTARLARLDVHDGLRHGGELLLRGVSHRIHHTGQLRGLTMADLDEGQPVLKVGGLEEHIGRRISTYLKKEARADLEPLVRRHAATVGRPVKSLAFKDTRSRWGSCSWDGNLSFSWRIVMAPPLVIDYLAAHEVAHLKEMNHGPRFWNLCRQLCPEMDKAKAWLKHHGSGLHAIDFS